MFVIVPEQILSSVPEKRGFYRRSACCPWVIPGLFAFFVVVGCARFEPSPRDLLALVPPEEFTLYETEAPAPDRWWESFNSPELNRLVEMALDGNLTLRQIQARLEQAEMLAIQAGAARLPELNLTGDASVTRRRTQLEGSSATDLDRLLQRMTDTETLLGPGAPTDGSLSSFIRDAQNRLNAAERLADEGPPSSVTTTTRSYRFGLGSSYEVDLWGRVRARHRAARLEVDSSREDVYAAMLSLSGMVARQWLLVTAKQREQALVQQQLALNNTTLDLIELRFTQGLVSALDVFQQRQIVAQTESLLPGLEEAAGAALFELAVLLGLPPQAPPEIEWNELPAVGPLPDPGIPADLLARRPDVRAAGLLLNAADWRVSAARADRLPAIRLNASASYGADAWSALFDNWMATLAGSLTGPLFDGGRRRAEVERTLAVVDERLAVYRGRILESVKEVESAMLRERKQAEYVAALERERDAARAVHARAFERYLGGVVDYLPVLSSLTQLQALERRLVQAELTRLERRVQLNVALGGAWMEERALSPSPAADAATNGIEQDER